MTRGSETTRLEDLFVAECRRQGHQPSADAVRQAAVELCGSAITTEGLIRIPGKGTISPVDFVRSLRNHVPEAFGKIDVEQPQHGNLTERMRLEVAASRNPSVPADWQQVRKRYATDSLTGRMMDELAAARRNGI
jgi:hypothetical protein